MLVEVGLANAAVAAVLALLALLAGALCRRPALAHVLWLLVLIKLITPPLFRVPVPGLREPAPAAAPKPKPPAREAAVAVAAGPVVPTLRMPFTKIADFGKVIDPALAMAAAPPLQAAPVVAAAEPTPDPAPPPAPEPAPKPAGMGALGWAGVVWLAGAGVWFLLAAWRVAAFQRQLAGAKPAPQAFAATVRRLCAQMKLARVPSVWIVPGPLPPMLWSLGPPRLYLPAGLVSRLQEPGLAAMLVHELAHLKRGDHWVRWLELLVAGLYWWYPVTWLARRRISSIEEDCCDAWVVSELPGYGAAYAGALLETLDFLARQNTPVPPLASGCGRLAALKRRLTAIIQSPPPPRVSPLGWVGVMLVALTLPLGLARTAAPPPA
ncbi:MAG: M56 family metallopeptidase, partial [Gemmataceae bacterium]